MAFCTHTPQLPVAVQHVGPASNATLDSRVRKSRLEHNMNKREKLADLRHFISRYGLPPDRSPVPLGANEADALLGGGLRPGAVHEIFAQDWGAGGFAACLAIRVMRQKTLFWIRTDYAAMEYGALSATGFLELGGDPEKLLLLSAANSEDALSAAADILACPHLGAMVLELEGQARALDLAASRRLGLIAEESGVALFLLREGADPRPSIALTRWQVQSLASRLEDDDWGSPRFRAALTRHRLGGLGKWIMEWNPQDGIFRQEAAHSGVVAAASFDRQAHPSRRFA
jgi:protein ImuA